ncbi:MAG: hypothetical protein JKY49_14405 [Cohaesibacteraceae bacterium]|nr:hypothetical protein [Cohaesibacteraceae bacterium]MBL4875710.1 hypothetical protein [Cohaesibacteraceae bacterium]
MSFSAIRSDDLPKDLCRFAVYAAMLLVIIRGDYMGITLIEGSDGNSLLLAIGWLRVISGFVVAWALIKDHGSGYFGFTSVTLYTLIIGTLELYVAYLHGITDPAILMMPLLQMLGCTILYVLVLTDYFVYRPRRRAHIPPKPRFHLTKKTCARVVGAWRSFQVAQTPQ